MTSNEFLKVIEKSESLKAALEVTGITRKEFYTWVSDKEFAIKVSRSAVAAELVVEDALFVKSLQGNTEAMKLFFNRRKKKDNTEPESYIDRQLKILRNLKK